MFCSFGKLAFLFIYFLFFFVDIRRRIYSVRNRRKAKERKQTCDRAINLKLCKFKRFSIADQSRRLSRLTYKQKQVDGGKMNNKGQTR